jgi:hypothetical protein
MDFGRIQSSGVSKILLKGQSHSAFTGLAKVKMQEVWHYTNGTIFLDASALLYDFSGKMMRYVDYSTTRYTLAGNAGGRRSATSGAAAVTTRSTIPRSRGCTPLSLT